MNHLIPKKKIKKRNNYPCSLCGKDINIGEKYISVTYDDGFLKKLSGAYHINCYKKYKNESSKT